MTILATLLPGLTDLLGRVIDRAIPDQAKADEAKLKVLQLVQTGELAELAAKTDLAKAAADIVKTEAASAHWLAANWRPLTALTFVTLIVARFLGYTAPGISEAEYLKLWSIMEIMIGGYTLVRSAEKVVPAIATAIATRNGKTT